MYTVYMGRRTEIPGDDRMIRMDAPMKCALLSLRKFHEVKIIGMIKMGWMNSLGIGDRWNENA